MDEEELPATVDDLAPYVLTVLNRDGFFPRLDEAIWPSHSLAPEACDHTLGRTKAILAEMGMDSEAIWDVILVFQSQGACCDCEVLYNVADDSRLKAAYWKARADENRSDH